MTTATRWALLVEDNPADVLLIQRVNSAVEPAMKLTWVDTLTKALRALERSLPDILLLDLSLPDSSGLQGLYRLRGAYPELPVVVLTGLDDASIADRAIAAGAQDYLVKSADITPDLLVRSMRHAHGRQHLVTELSQTIAALARSREHLVRSRKRLERSEASFRSIVSSADGIIVADKDGVVRFANPAALKMFCTSAERFVGQALPFSLEPGELREVELGEGRDRTVVELAVVRTTWQGAAATLAGLRDITKRRLLQDRLRDGQKMEMVGRLAAGLAHDLNNLLTVARTQVYLTQLELDPEHSAWESLQTIDETIQVTSRLVSRMLASGRRQSTVPRQIAPAPVIGELSKLLKHIVGSGVHLAVEIRQPLPDIVIDPLHLEQVILNLIENARDAIARRGEISLVVDGGDGPPSELVLRVSDDGPGIAPQIGDRLFEPFVTTKGSGLTTVRDIVTQAGGEISFSSTPSEGTTFTVRLPAAPHPSEPPMALRLRNSGRPMPRVLIVDGEAIVRMLLCSVLREEGYQVWQAPDAHVALRVLTDCDSPPDLLLTDVELSGLSGQALAVRAWKTNPDLPVIFMSGTTGGFPNIAGPGGSALAVLPKPLQLPDLLRVIEEKLFRAR